MNKRDDGGPAFPVLEHYKDNTSAVRAEGMTLRDYFAAHAPPPPDGWLIFKGAAGDLVNYAEDYALWRGVYADAQLKERAK